MRARFLLIYIGEENENLSDFGQRQMQVVDLATDELGAPTSDAIAEAAREILMRADQFDKRQDYSRKIAIFPIEDARSVTVLPVQSAEVVSWGSVA